MSLSVAVVVWILVVGGALAFFATSARQLGSRSSEELLGSWLTGQPAPDRAWADAFLGWFDRVFRVRTVATRFGPIALPSFARSVLASFVCLLLLTVVWGLNKEALSFGAPARGLAQVGAGQVAGLVLVYGVLTVVTNWVPDYLSLVESRFVLGRLARAQGPLAVFAWLVLDLVVTLGLAFAVLWAAGRIALPLLEGRIPALYVGCLTSDTFDVGTAWTMFVSGLRFETPPATLNYDAAGIYIYSTFFTSAWVWLFLSAGKLVQAFAHVVPTSGEVVRARPALALGLAAAALLSVVGGAGLAALDPPAPDVWIATPDDTRAQAEEVRALAVEQGYHVVVGGPADLEPGWEAAPLVVVFTDETGGAPRGSAPRGTGTAEALLSALERDQRCGLRGRDTVVVVTERNAIDRVRRLLARPNLLLAPEQMEACQERYGYPRRPIDCSTSSTLRGPTASLRSRPPPP